MPVTASITDVDRSLLIIEAGERRMTWNGAATPVNVIDELDHVHFTHGQCHALALAVHEATGWPLAGCNWTALSNGEIPDHVFAVDPDGMSVDIFGRHRRGAHPDGALRDDWRALQPQDVLALEVMGYDQADVPYARRYVTAVLAGTVTRHRQGQPRPVPARRLDRSRQLHLSQRPRLRRRT